MTAPAAPPPAGLQALVLDFGGVISRTMFETHALSEAALGLAPGTLSWRGPFDVAGDPLWQAMQAGQISERDYWLTRSRETGRLLGEGWADMQTLVKRARGADPSAVIRPEAVAAVQVVKAAGLKLAILSNELDLFYGADFRARLPLLELFDHVVDATYTGILKPDARAYAQVAQGLGLPMSACLFLDDQARNVAGAQAAGMPVLAFDVLDPAATYRQALGLLGVVLPEALQQA